MLQLHQCQLETAHEIYTCDRWHNLVAPHCDLILGPPQDASWKWKACTDRIFKKRATLLENQADGYIFGKFQLLELSTVTVRNCGIFLASGCIWHPCAHCSPRASNAFSRRITARRSGFTSDRCHFVRERGCWGSWSQHLRTTSVGRSHEGAYNYEFDMTLSSTRASSSDTIRHKYEHPRAGNHQTSYGTGVWSVSFL